MLRKFIAFALLVVIAASCSQEDEVDYGPIDQKIIEDYIAEHEITGTQSTSSGLYYVIQKPGTATHPTIKSRIWVNYVGYLTDGTVFEWSNKYGKPTDTELSIMIAGWKEGLQLIGAGGKIQLFVPSELAYGQTGKNSIPPNTVILFDIELVDFY